MGQCNSKANRNYSKKKKIQTCTQWYKKKEGVFKIIPNCDNQSPLAAYVKDMCSQQQ